MSDIRNILDNFIYYDYRKLFNTHLLWAKENNRVTGDPKWFDEPFTLNVIGIRCNSEADFNFGKYNDFLILILNKPDDRYDQAIIPVTVDPNRNKDGIAHLRQGVWNSYVIRPHKWESRTFSEVGTIYRWAICQDKDVVEVIRTDGKGNIIKADRGMFGINIHDSGGYYDSSLGCTVIKNDNHYLKLFLPYIYDLKLKKKVPLNYDNLTYCLINHVNFEKYLESKILREEYSENSLGINKEVDMIK